LSFEFGAGCGWPKAALLVVVVVVVVAAVLVSQLQVSYTVAFEHD